MAFAIKYRGDRPGVPSATSARRGEQRRVPRGAQHGRALEAARRLHLENNRYGMGTALERASARSRHLRARRARTTWPARWCDGQDVLAMHAAMERAVERARTEQAPDAARGPHLPLHGPLDVRPDPAALPHARKSSRSTRSAIRSRVLVAAAASQDGHASTRPACEALDEEVKAEVQDACEFADAEPGAAARGAVRGRATSRQRRAVPDDPSARRHLTSDRCMPSSPTATR